MSEGSTDGYGIDASGNLWAWGANDSGELGNATTSTTPSTPTEVLGLDNVTQVAAGSGDAVALKSNGTVWTWGQGGDGQLGTGGTANTDSPAQVSGLSGVTQIAAGLYTDYALKSDGTVWTWGDGSNGELGDGSASAVHLAPVQISGLTNIKQIVAGPGETAFAVDTSGDIWGWGYNGYGQVGNGSSTNVLSPVDIAPNAYPTSLSAGTFDSYALINSTSLYGWGDNSAWELANGSSTSALTPTPISSYQPASVQPSVSYSYDGHGLLSSRTSGGATSQLVWDQDSASNLPTLLSDGTNNYIYGPDGLAVEQITDSTVSYLHHDQIGSTRLITNATGNVAASATYSPYGLLQASTGSTSTNLLYAGQLADPTTGLEYDQARWYDPSTGQFVSMDPLRAITQQPYDYADDDPVESSDPTGLDAVNLGEQGAAAYASYCQQNSPPSVCDYGASGVSKTIGSVIHRVASVISKTGGIVASVGSRSLSSPMRHFVCEFSELPPLFGRLVC